MKKALLIAGLLAGAGVASVANAQVKNPGVILEAVTSDWTSLDPVACYDLVCGEVLQNTLDNLVFYDGANAGKFVPWLATEVPTKKNGGISPDGKSYTFKLRSGIKFTDGSPLTIQDVEYSIKRMLVASSDDGSVTLLTEALFGDADVVRAGDKPKFSLELINQAVVVKGDAIVFNLAKPFAPFLSILALPYMGIYSKADAIKRGEWDGTAATWKKFNNPKLEDSKFAKSPPLGTGPFMLERYDAGKTLALKRNENFWQEKAKLSRVIFEFVKDETTRIQMLKAGDADFAGVTRAQLGQVAAFDGVKVVDGLPNLGLDFIFMNQKIDGTGTGFLGSATLDGKGIPADFFSDLNLRKGLAASFDYTSFINEVLLGKAFQNNTVLIKGLLGYEEKGPKYKFDKALAAKYFKQAWGGKVWEQGFTVPVFFNSGNTTRQRVLEILKRGVESINPKFKLEVREIQRSELFKLRSSNKITLSVGNWSADYADPHNFAFPFLASSGSFPTIIGYKNATLDMLIDQAVDETDPAKRVKLYKAIQKIGFDEVVHIPLVQTVGYAVSRDWIKGRVYNPMYAGDYFYFISK